MEKKIREVLEEKVNPVLAEHYGGAVLSKYEDNIVWVKLTGSCCSCPSAQMTIEDVVKQIIMEECDDVRDVKLDTAVSDDILDMARKILNKEL
nr:NifU family protein [uncultured Aminipila sp.]